MALTTEQEAEIITRLEAGEMPRVILEAMDISRKDFLAFRRSNREVFYAAKNSKSSRLVRLNKQKDRLESRQDLVEEQLAKVDENIATIEAEG